MTMLMTLLGIALNAIVLRDIFHTLFRPSGSGALSSLLVRDAWRTARHAARPHPDRLSVVGPLCLVLIILLWVVGLVLGWACLLWPHLPEQFRLSTGMASDRNDSFLDAIYLSLVTLGYGEITPQATWLRMVAPLEAVIGFSLFTAAISWIMSIYPSLARRRHLARAISLLRRYAEQADTTILAVSLDGDDGLLWQLTQEVVSVRDDFVPFSITHYFRENDQASVLDVALPHLAALARDASQYEAPDIRASGSLLLAALGDPTSCLAEGGLECEAEAAIEEVLNAYAADQLRRLDRSIAFDGS